MIYAKPSTALVVVFRAYLASDHVSVATGKAIAITISKNGGAFGNPNAGATNATEISSGFYKVTLDTTDTNTAGPLAVRGAVATIDDVGAIFYVGQSPADVTHLLGTAWLAPGTAGTPDVNVKLWNALTTVELPLVPTTAGRKLDVSAGGEAGVDWANVGGQATSVNLSATDTFRVGSVTGSVGSVTGAVGSVTGAVGSVTGAVGSVTGNVGGNVVGSTASVTGNVGGNVTGSVGSVVGSVGGNVTGSVGSVVGAVGSVTGAVGSVTGNVGGNVTGSVGSVVGAVGSVTGNVGGNVTGSVGSLAAQAKADVNAEVVDTLATDTYAEPGQEAPGATISLSKKIGFLYKAWRNKKTKTATATNLFNDDAATVDQKTTDSDDGTTGTRGEVASGP